MRPAVPPTRIPATLIIVPVIAELNHARLQNSKQKASHLPVRCHLAGRRLFVSPWDVKHCCDPRTVALPRHKALANFFGVRPSRVAATDPRPKAPKMEACPTEFSDSLFTDSWNHFVT